jgi:hypothetical protein
MTDDAPKLRLELDADDDAGEFFLPHVDSATSPDPENERARYDDQILAALVSP